MRLWHQWVELTKRHKAHSSFIIVLLFSYILFKFAYLFQHGFSHLVGVASYLAWHNLFEFTDTLVSVSIFLVTYFTYERTGRPRSILLGNVFLTTGIITVFHTLSFKGMPEFFIENNGANRATTFWILSRLILAIGFTAASFVPVFTKFKINRAVFFYPAIAISLSVFIAVTYFGQFLPPMYIEEYGLTGTKIALEYVIIALFATAMVKTITEYRRNGDQMQMLTINALLLSIFSELAFTSYFRVYDIYNYLGHLYKAAAAIIIFRFIFIYNVQKPYVDLSEAQQKLENYAENLDKLVDQRTKEIKMLNSKLLKDLEYARDIQRSMLPLRMPNEDRVLFSARYFPAERVSGDFYNVFKIDEQNIGIYIGDVSGHGVPAAMLTIFVDQSIKVIRDMDGDSHEILKPSSILKSLYKSFNKTNFQDEIYFVMFYAVYNLKTGKLTYSSAGMNVCPFLVSKAQKVKDLRVNGFPICKFFEYHVADYQDDVIFLKSGEKLLLYTDGLVEAGNEKGSGFTEERLKSSLEKHSHKPGALLAEIITREVFEFIGTAEVKDDITFIIIEII